MFLSLAALFVSAPVAQAQRQGRRLPPRIGYVYPAGGQESTTFTVAVGGQNLNGTNVADFSGSGAQAEVIDYNRPLTQKEFNELREKVQQLQKRRAASSGKGGADGAPVSAKTAWTPEDRKMLAELRQTLTARRPNRQANPAIAETITLEVTLAPDTPPGERELRLKTPNGLSNPLVFCVGRLPEFSGKPAAAPPSARPDRDTGPRTARSKTETAITLPAVVNGQIMPGEADRYRFPARRGQRLVFAVSARALIPYLADAVPGWFQATLALYDAEGREIAYNDDFRFNPDPVLSCEIPEDGDYTIEIKDAIYRGREDFVYRIAMGELPFVTGIFPLGGQAGERIPVEMTGWNLPPDATTLDTKNQPPGTLRLSVRNHGLLSNSVPFALGDGPECGETEPNDRPEDAQPVALPMTVNGRIDRPDDQDVFRFEGRAGDTVVAEIFARRLNSPLDAALKLADGSGRQLAFNDDHEDKGSGLTTHHADSRLSATLPADGTYYINLGDVQHQGGAEYGYRLSLGPPRPDFELRVAPSSLNVRAGASVPLTVYALRKDGFSGEIALGLRGRSSPFALSGARIPANQDKVQLTLTAPATLRNELYDVVLDGGARIDGRPVIHAAVPAEDMMQAFSYRHLVSAKELKVRVVERGFQRPVVGMHGGGPLKIPAGGTARLRVAVQTGRFPDNKVEVELSDPPEGITIRKSSTGIGAVEVVLACDAAKTKPGLQGNLLLEAFASRTGTSGGNKNRANQRMPLGVLPAIPFEVVAAGGGGR